MYVPGVTLKWVGEKAGKEGCEISAFPVQIRNAISTIRESVLS